MEYERKEVAIHWQIENVKYIPWKNVELCSSVVPVDVLDGTKWKLVLREINSNRIILAIKREAVDNGPKNFEMYYSFSAHPLNRKFPYSGVTGSYTFQNGQMCPKVEVNGFWMFGEYPFHTPETIIIRCQIWRSQGSISKSENLLVRTLIRLEHSIFISDVKIFSKLSFYGRTTLKTVSSSAGERQFSITFYLCKNRLKGVTDLEINFNDLQRDQLFHLKLFILDSFGNKTEAGKLNCDCTSTSSLTLPNISREELLKEPALYLPNDTLSLFCEITFSSGKEYENIEKTDCEVDTVAKVEQTAFSNAIQLQTTREGVSCDIQLKTATETLPAHTAILSAQSPVFEAMFESNVKESIEKCIQINDVDAETLKRMLAFLYSGTLEEIEWREAVKLHVAADKYQIFTLKSQCTDHLKRNIDLSNCCVLWHLADMHKDEDLKETVLEYIICQEKKVLYSDQWRDLEAKHPHLAINYFRRSYVI